MHKLALLGLVAAIQLGAADPRIGSWTLISAQSSLDPPNKLSITPLHDGVHVVISGDTHLDFTAKWDGHETSVQGNPAFNQIELRRIDKNQAEVKEKKDGAVVATVRDKLSSDGNELTSTTSEKGRADQITVWTRSGGTKAADNLFAGEWTQDLSKTRLRQGLALKIEADGKEGVRFSGEFSYTARFDGKEYDLKNSSNDTVTLELVDAHTVDSIYRRDDQVAQKDRWVVSADGQQMTLTTTGMLETGQQVKETHGISETVTSLCHARCIGGERLPAVAHGVELTSRNRDDSLSLHESQDAVDCIFERRIRLAPCGSIPSRLIAGTVIAFELHRRDVVHGAHQKVQQRKEQIFLPASPDQLGNEVGKAEHLELPPGRLCNQSGNIQHVRVIVPRNVISLIRRAGSCGNRNDIVSRDVCGNETNLVQSIDSNAVIHHERNQTNGDIEVIASAGNGGTHQSGPENPRSKSPAARVHNHLFRYPFGLAVSKIEKLHILVQVGLIQNFLNRPAKHEGSRDVIEALGPSFERQS